METTAIPLPRTGRRRVAAAADGDARAEASERLVRRSPHNLQRVFFVNSASEAVDAALKIARRFRDRRKVIAFRGGYHGRTYGAGAVTALPCSGSCGRRRMNIVVPP